LVALQATATPTSLIGSLNCKWMFEAPKPTGAFLQLAELIKTYSTVFLGDGQHKDVGAWYHPYSLDHAPSVWQADLIP
jgi:hypothetical protein